MDEHARMNHVSAMIAALNDRLRVTGQGGRTVLTRAVASMSAEDVERVLVAVRKFDSFNADNDPWGEHDFGQVQLGDKTFIWKIDAYDLNCEFASPDSSDPLVTSRILTIMSSNDL